MKTLVYFIAGITLNILWLSGCTKETTTTPTTTCGSCVFQPPHPSHEILLEKKTPYSGFNVVTATLSGDFIYPSIVNWYNVDNDTRKLKKTDNLISPSWNKSYYHFESAASSHLKVECEVIANDGLTITKSINF